MPNLVNDFEVRKETLRALGGNPDGLANIYEVDKEILKLISEGGGGIDWNTIKQKLAEDGVESIKFIMGNEQVILTASEVKTLLNQTVQSDTVTNIWSGTQQEYDSLESHLDNVLYVIK